MNTNEQCRGADRGYPAAHRSPDEARRLVPVLVRALETGRGPTGLVNWLARRLPRPHDSGAPDGHVTHLAAELNRVLRRAGVTETLAD